jgi:phosphohistidine phosphatase
MNLYLMRHADAVDNGKHGVQRDADRMLSEKGLRQISRIAGFLEDQGVRLDSIVSSPFLRARQTAELLAGRVAPDIAVTLLHELEPGVVPETFMRALRRYRSDSLLAVGHMPDLSYLVGSLMAKTANPLLDFKTAAVASLEVEDGLHAGTAVLQWFVRPRILK